ncbi:hypothetical protein COO60DRAFT_1102196 [Scenedesmus sp. NREL 46B-D3]|nr:hypothetical protein COO60DRAFT_1102196 [Scenedesmus sp. NREL 46B-D3]
MDLRVPDAAAGPKLADSEAPLLQCCILVNTPDESKTWGSADATYESHARMPGITVCQQLHAPRSLKHHVTVRHPCCDFPEPGDASQLGACPCIHSSHRCHAGGGGGLPVYCMLVPCPLTYSAPASRQVRVATAHHACHTHQRSPHAAATHACPVAALASDTLV